MRSGLQRKLFLIVMTVAVVPLVLLSIMGYYTTRQSLLQAATQNLRALVRLQATQFDEYLHEKKHLLRALSGEHSKLASLLINEPRSSLKKSTTRSFRRELRLLLLQKMKRGKLNGLGIYRVNDEKLFSVGRSLPKILPPFTFHQKGINILGVVHFSKASQTILRMAIPLHLGGLSKFYLVADFPFSLHQRFLQEKQAPAFRGDIYLLSEEKQVLCGSLDIEHMHHVFGRTKQIPFPIAKKPNAWTKVHRYERKGTGFMLGVALPIREIRWTLLIELSEANALRPLQRLRTQSIFLMLVFFLLLALAIAFVSSRMVRPLQQLLEATSAFSKGEFSTTLPNVSSDEIGALTQAFGEMGTELHSYYTELEKKVAERTHELEEAQLFSDLLFHAIPEVILVTDRELRVIKANRQAQELFGEDVFGSFCYHVFEGEGATCNNCLASEVIRTGEPRSVEDEVPHPKNGEMFYKDFYPIHNHKGEVIGVLESAKIITHKKQRLAQVIHQEKIAAVGLMASGVAHEIGNPLSSIFAIVQRLKYKAKDDADRKTYAELEERCLFITRIIETLSDSSRKKPERSVPLDLSKEIEKAVTLIRFDRRLREVHLKQDISPELPLLWGREDALSQIVTNLLINALDAVQDSSNPSIEIKAWPSRDGALFHVSDNGYGIEKDQEQKVFEPFFTTKGEAKGTGLGLSVCKQIVAHLGGQIRAYPNVPKGTIFEVSLPSRNTLTGA